MPPTDLNTRMPVQWTATGRTLKFCDAGKCSFFHFVHMLLAALNTAAGKQIHGFEDGIEILKKSREVHLKFELKAKELRFYATDFGVFSKIDNALPYSAFFDSYHLFADAPGLPEIERTYLGRAFEVVINAIERKAPGLFLQLVESGLPAGFSFEDWKGERVVPGQILRRLPSKDTREIIAWSKSDAFATSVAAIFQEIDAKWDGIESRN